MKHNWDKVDAERILSTNKGDNKTIYLDGTLTLSKCAAADFLVNKCGYVYGERKEKS